MGAVSTLESEAEQAQINSPWEFEDLSNSPLLRQQFTFMLGGRLYTYFKFVPALRLAIIKKFRDLAGALFFPSKNSTQQPTSTF
jgi:hypothetical protein